MSREFDSVRAAERAARMTAKQAEGLDKFLAEKKAKVASVMDRFQTRCQRCNVTSGKTRIWHTDDGYLCGRCLPEGVTPQTLLMENLDRVEHLAEEAAKPKPDNYGDWA